MEYKSTLFSEVTNNGRPMNPSLSEDSVADTAISKRNSDGMIFFKLSFISHILSKKSKNWISI